VARGELLPLPAWASEAVDLINDLPSATELVGRLAAEAEYALSRASGR
jgi:nitronate monooxygenase